MVVDSERIVAITSARSRRNTSASSRARTEASLRDEDEALCSTHPGSDRNPFCFRNSHRPESRPSGQAAHNAPDWRGGMPLGVKQHKHRVYKVLASSGKWPQTACQYGGEWEKTRGELLSARVESDASGRPRGRNAVCPKPPDAGPDWRPRPLRRPKRSAREWFRGVKLRPDRGPCWARPEARGEFRGPRARPKRRVFAARD